MIPKRINSMSESWKSYPHRSGGPKHLEKSEYSRIIKSFMEKLAYEIITTGDIIVLPYAFGAMQAIKFKSSWGSNKDEGLVDYAATRRVYGEHNKQNPNNKKAVRIANRSTDGYWCDIHWYKRKTARNRYNAKFRYARHFEFKLSRPNRRPNTYNKRNPEVSLIPFFREKGWLLYQEKE